MIEWWVWVCAIIGINIIVIGRFLAWRKFKRHEYRWYRRGMDGADAKAHCFLFSDALVPLIPLHRYFSFCRGKYLDTLGNWERIEDPSPDIMCSKCVDFIRRKKKDSGVEEMNMKRLKNTLLYIVQTPVALLAAIIFSTWLRFPDWVKKIWYRLWMRE